MSQAISRRAVARGALWAAPVVAATATIPAYAASTSIYGISSSSSGGYRLDGSGCMSSLDVTNTQAAPGQASGIAVIYPDGQGETQSVDITNYEVVIYLPANLVDSFDVTSGNFTYAGAFNPDTPTITRNDGTTVSTAGLEAYVFRYNGTLTTQTQLDDGALDGEPGAFFTASATGFGYCESNLPVDSFTTVGATITTADGFTAYRDVTYDTSLRPAVM
ncbi:hypothetical protein IDM48_02205 [Rothia amarae]|uniref:Uncharacterized protein n=1 Tax=Rothia amarae TaxID=169480 RepID=A0A7H2BKS4_9MICC|nr:hypothetical protein [Rothia amarae]QNV40270.1 hypothetical protein IDM48_02205 [Rothia amarae]